MPYSFDCENFKLGYKESPVESPVLWESHCHARFEMIGVLEGDVSITLEGKSYRLTEHQVAVISPLSYHTLHANKRGRYRRITALFDTAFIPEPLCNRLSGNTGIAIFRAQQLERLKKVCLESDLAFYRPLAEALMLQTLYECVETAPIGPAIETDEFLQKTLDYIDRHLTQKILLDDLARLTSRSKSSFCHLFEEKMQISPKQYILQKRLAIAAKLMQDGLPPTAAALRVGYENYSNFYRVYQKHFGKAPTRRKGKA